MNSLGATISLKETSRRKSENRTAVIYGLFSSGLPKDKVYTLLTTSFDLRPTIALDGVTFDDSGRAVCAGRPDTCGDANKPNDPIDLVLFATRGEPKRFSLVSEDGRIKAFAYVVPFPIIGSDRGCSLEVLLLMPNAEAVLLRGSGFLPHSSVHFVLDSEGETQEGDSNVADDGSYYNAQMPYKSGKSEGTARATLRAQTCNPSVSYPWGKRSYQLE